MCRGINSKQGNGKRPFVTQPCPRLNLSRLSAFTFLEFPIDTETHVDKLIVILLTILYFRQMIAAMQET